MSENTEIVVSTRESSISLGAIQANGPAEIVERASTIAKALADIIDRRGLYSVIGGRRYVRVEGWTTLGAMLGVLPREVETHPIDNGNGYESVVELVRTSDGAVIGRGSAICTRDEPNWGNRPDYALRSMAITRATGKAFRLAFSWIVTLAGYEPTPAEEMDFAAPEPQVIEPPRVRREATRPLEPDKLREFLHRKEQQAPDGTRGQPASEKQARLVARIFTEAFSGAPDATERYHIALKWLWGVGSASSLSKSQASATLDWLLDSTKEEYTLHEHAPAEAEAVYHRALRDQGVAAPRLPLQDQDQEEQL